MNELTGLWIPIVISACSLLLISGIVSCFVRPRLSDWKELPEEDATVEFLQKSGISPGLYLFPGRRKRADALSEESRQQRMDSGPWGTVNIGSRPPNLARKLMQAMAFFLLLNIVVAHLATQALDPGDGFAAVFQFTGTAAALSCAFGGVPNAIWFGAHFRAAWIDVIQGVASGIITGAVFAAFWPS